MPTRIRHLAPTLLLVALLGLVAALAQEATNPAVAVSDAGEYGPHLVDGAGMSLYLYTEDPAGSSACVDRCVVNWPPLLTDGAPGAGEGVDADLLGTLERADGGLQVTYAGHPLYRYARDASAGDTRGQGLGERFFLVAPTGEAAREKAVGEEAPVDEELLASLMDAGAQVFAGNCAVCHGAEGQGGIGPRLDGNSNLERGELVAKRVVHGFPEHGMPPFGDQLDDRQVAAVATYVRNAWSNDFGVLSEEEVQGVR